jgi:hypothetical protein
MADKLSDGLRDGYVLRVPGYYTLDPGLNLMKWSQAESSLLSATWV